MRAFPFSLTGLTFVAKLPYISPLSQGTVELPRCVVKSVANELFLANKAFRQILCDCGADLDLTDEEGNSPLH